MAPIFLRRARGEETASVEAMLNAAIAAADRIVAEGSQAVRSSRLAGMADMVRSSSEFSRFNSSASSRQRGGVNKMAETAAEPRYHRSGSKGSSKSRSGPSRIAETAAVLQFSSGCSKFSSSDSSERRYGISRIVETAAVLQFNSECSGSRGSGNDRRRSGPNAVAVAIGASKRGNPYSRFRGPAEEPAAMVGVGRRSPEGRPPSGRRSFRSEKLANG